MEQIFCKPILNIIFDYSPILENVNKPSAIDTLKYISEFISNEKLYEIYLIISKMSKSSKIAVRKLENNIEQTFIEQKFIDENKNLYRIYVFLSILFCKRVRENSNLKYFSDRYDKNIYFYERNLGYKNYNEHQKDIDYYHEKYSKKKPEPKQQRPSFDIEWYSSVGTDAKGNIIHF